MKFRKYIRFFHLIGKCDYRYIFLFYLLSLICGTVTAGIFVNRFSDLIIPSLLISPSFVLMFLVNLAPLFLTVCFLHFSLHFVCCLYFAALAFCFGFAGATVLGLAGSGGWLIQLLITFSCGAVSVLNWFIFLSGRRYTLWKLSCSLLIAVLAVTLVDYFVIAKLSYSLLRYF